MRYLNGMKMLPIILFLLSAPSHAEDTPKKSPRLEEMTAAELKEALKKSHAEMESRLGLSDSNFGLPEKKTGSSGKISSLAEKRAYESSAQSRINILNYKIQTLENSQRDNWGYSQMDAYKLRDIQAKAEEQLMRIKSDNTDGWKTNKNALDSLLRRASDF